MRTTAETSGQEGDSLVDAAGPARSDDDEDEREAREHRERREQEERGQELREELGTIS